jgi:uncharacterized membrane protein
LLLVGSYLILTVLRLWAAGFKTAATIPARIVISLFFAFTALGHFIRAAKMSAMLPPLFPMVSRPFTSWGILELPGATGYWISV